jgi:hypothetical protein
MPWPHEDAGRDHETGRHPQDPDMREGKTALERTSMLNFS